MRAAADPAQLALGLVAARQRAARLELGGGAVELGDGARGFTGLGQCAPGDRARGLPLSIGAQAQLAEQRRLADTRLADQRERTGPPPLKLLERLVERPQLRGATDQLLGGLSHR
jgi:hypothetical protein